MQSEAIYYGDPRTQSTYSRGYYHPLTWPPELLSLKARVEQTPAEKAYANLAHSFRLDSRCTKSND